MTSKAVITNPRKGEVGRTKVTPPKLARRWGISPDKILCWIRSGELHAIDAATRQGQRPRYLIDEADIVAFESRRSAAQERQPVRQPRRKQTKSQVIEFF